MEIALWPHGCDVTSPYLQRQHSGNNRSEHNVAPPNDDVSRKWLCYEITPGTVRKIPVVDWRNFSVVRKVCSLRLFRADVGVSYACWTAAVTQQLVSCRVDLGKVTVHNDSSRNSHLRIMARRWNRSSPVKRPIRGQKSIDSIDSVDSIPKLFWF